MEQKTFIKKKINLLDYEERELDQEVTVEASKWDIEKKPIQILKGRYR